MKLGLDRKFFTITVFQGASDFFFIFSAQLTISDCSRSKCLWSVASRLEDNRVFVVRIAAVAETCLGVFSIVRGGGHS